MSTARPRGARRASFRARVGRLVVPAVLAVGATGAVVTTGIVAAAGDHLPVDLTAVAPMKVELSTLGSRERSASRSAPRTTLQPQAVGHRYATADLNVWTEPTDRSTKVGEVKSGTRLAVTGQVVRGWAEVLLKGEARYVNADYLADHKPTGLAAVAGISDAACPDGSETEAGLTSGAIRMFRAVCAAFPALTTYGGWDAHGEHSSGKAVDFMVSDSALGQAVADWLVEHAAELGIYDVIWQQHIWTQERASEGWRLMPDRGSPTANHEDHVHASVY